MMMDSEEEEEQTALVCDNGKFRDIGSGSKIGSENMRVDYDFNF